MKYITPIARVAPTVIFLLSIVAANAAQPVRFSGQVGQSVTYNFKIQVGTGNDAGNYPGQIVYSVKSATPELIQLNVNGNLHGVHSTPIFIRTGRGSSLPTLESVNCRSTLLGISPLGEVKVSQKDEPLGLLLGTLGQLAIAPLPPPDAQPLDPKMKRVNAADAAVTWSAKNVLTVAQNRNPFGFSSDFARRAGIDNQELSVANESWKYVAHPAENDRVRVDHQYELTSQHLDPPMKMQGDGTAVFDAADGFFESLQINRVLFVSRDGVEVKLPVSVSVVRETIQERDARVAAAARIQADNARPLTDEERKELIAALATGASAFDANRALHALIQKTPRHDPIIAKALLARADAAEGASRMVFYSAAGRFDESIKHIAKDREDYSRGNFPVGRTGEVVTSTSRLKVGQVLAASREPHTGFVAVEVVDILAGNTVSVRPVGGSGRVEQKPVRSLRYPPDTVIQSVGTNPVRRSTREFSRREAAMSGPPTDAPVKEAVDAELPETNATRTWSDQSGLHKIEASFIELRGDKVRLESKDGKLIEVPLASLSKADADMATEFDKAKAEPVNPFQVVK